MRWWMATEMGLFCKGLQLAHLNVQSIRGKLDQVKDMIVTSKVDLYGFSETFSGACPGFLKGGGGSNISWFPKKKVIRF